MIRFSNDYTPEELMQIVDICMKALRSKDMYTFAHSERVGRIAEQMAAGLQLSNEEMNVCRVLGKLHDIGKLFVPNAILRKPASLDEKEWQMMRKHSDDAVRILSCMHFMGKYMDVVKALHERYDGKGYPDGLEGRNIPLAARILAVADSYDAMTSDRPYRKAQPLEYVYAELVSGRGKQFCPQAVDAALVLLEKNMRKPYAVVTESLKKLIEVHSPIAMSLPLIRPL